MRACYCLLALAVVAATCAVARKTHFFDDVGAVKQHSFHTPLLEDFVESGFHAWSFGSSAVVTNEYVQLTPGAHEGHGYLWNHYHSELSAFRAHFSIKLKQRPHHGLFAGGSECDTCGIAMWALKEPVRNSETSPFFGVPHHFEGIGVVLQQGGTMHLVAKESAESAANTLDDVSLGHCGIDLDTQQIEIVLSYHTHERRMQLLYRPPGAAESRTCVTTDAVGLPEKYYFGFTAFAKSSSPVGYEVVGMMVIPVDKATERPIDEAEEQRAKEFDRQLDRKEREFWHEERPDHDPRKAYEDEMHEREKPDHAAEGRHHVATQHDGGNNAAEHHRPQPPPQQVQPQQRQGDDLMDDGPAPADHGNDQGDDDGSDASADTPNLP